MFYKPTYCCHCGEKIDRAKWGMTDSRRFCQSCASEFVFKEWIPRLIVCAGISGLLFGFGALLTGKTEKPLNVVTTSQTPALTNPAQNRKSQPLSSDANAQNSAPPSNAANNSALPAQRQNSSDPNRTGNLRLQTSAKSKDKQNAANEAVYFCGAQTKKGTPCSRRVKGGGRCWQHAGQAAMLPPEKLLISQ
ncbi:MAG TPA: hypothetical protein VK400_13360 [Pyrinomonadaceae bacterium]|nr:hypothetical protein [Pyrinomonadaceae bacterium]